jgi:hypothetical protein
MFFRNASLKRLLAGVLVLALLLGGLWLWNGRASERPKSNVSLMSSIPLQWGEVSMEEVARGETQPALFYQKLSDAHKVTMVDTLSSIAKTNPDVLILAQPRMLNPAELVALDKWIRNGGRAIIFADPALQWPSGYPLGDNRRPLFTSFLSPLFAHWGLELVLPFSNDEEQMVKVQVGDQEVSVISHGNWVRKKSSEKSVSCRIDPSALVASCTPGKGRVVLIADADMLHDDSLAGGLMSSSQWAWLSKLISGQAANSPLPAGL